MWSKTYAHSTRFGDFQFPIKETKKDQDSRTTVMMFDVMNYWKQVFEDNIIL